MNNRFLETAVDLCEIRENLKTDPDRYIQACEAGYTRQLQKIGESLLGSDERNILLLAGPSSSGKTTTSNLLSSYVRKEGRRCFVVHLDDFYKNRDDIPYLPDGKQDFEGISALELSLLHDSMESLLTSGRTSLPEYDFTIGRRNDYVRPIHVRHGDAVIIEGLHALNPVLMQDLPDLGISKVCVTVSSSVSDGEERIIGPRKIRLLRRIIRDFNFRNSSVEYTLNMWPGVISGEKRYIYPYQESADFWINTFHPYEIAVYREPILRLLQGEDRMEGEREILSRTLSRFPSLEPTRIPKDSLLREFIKQ